MPDVATTLNNPGLLNSAENGHAEAHTQLEKAQEILHQFAAREPAAYGPRAKEVEQSFSELPK